MSTGNDFYQDAISYKYEELYKAEFEGDDKNREENLLVFNDQIDDLISDMWQEYFPIINDSFNDNEKECIVSKLLKEFEENNGISEDDTMKIAGCYIDIFTKEYDEENVKYYSKVNWDIINDILINNERELPEGVEDWIVEKFGDKVDLLIIKSRKAIREKKSEYL